MPSPAVVVNGTSFALNGDNFSYLFHVDDSDLPGELLTDHFGGTVAGPIPTESVPSVDGWVGMQGRVRREFPDNSRGDFRIPAVRIRESEGYAMADLQYRSHTVVPGKPALPGLPATFGNEQDVTTLVVHLYDNYSSIAADLSYSVFPRYDAIVRSVNVTNKGNKDITVEELASLSVDFPFQDLDMISLSGDVVREAHRERRSVENGVQGSVIKYSSSRI